MTQPPANAVAWRLGALVAPAPCGGTEPCSCRTVCTDPPALPSPASSVPAAGSGPSSTTSHGSAAPAAPAPHTSSSSDHTGQPGDATPDQAREEWRREQTRQAWLKLYARWCNQHKVHLALTALRGTEGITCSDLRVRMRMAAVIVNAAMAPPPATGLTCSESQRWSVRHFNRVSVKAGFPNWLKRYAVRAWRERVAAEAAGRAT